MEYLKSYIFKVHALAKGLFFGLMVTTAWMAYRVCESAIGGSSTLPQVWESVLIVGAALVITYLIDNALYHNAVSALAQTIEHKGLWRIRKEGAITTIILLCLMLGRFFFSGGATYLTGESTVTERQVSSNNIELVENLNRQKDAALNSIRSSKEQQANRILEEAKKEAADIKATAEALAIKKVETAIAQGSTSEQEAYKRNDWIRASYSNAIKKAKKEAYEMEEKAAQEAKAVLSAAKARHKSILASMEDELYRERNNSKWSQLETEVDRTISAQVMLWTAERWTYYLIDFILVVGGFFCSWLVAVYIVKTDATIETFFPDKPGLSDVVKETFASLYAYIVTVVAQIPAYFKAQTSVKMTKVAKSVSASTASYSAAIGKYIVASHPEVSAQVGAVAYQNAMSEAKQKALEKLKPSPTSDSNYKPMPKPAATPSETVAQQRNNSHISRETIELEVSNGVGATSATPPPVEQEMTQPERDNGATSATPVADNIKRSGGSFRSYLSRASEYAAAKEMTKAKECLDKALLALPYDHLRKARMQRVQAIKNLIDGQ